MYTPNTQNITITFNGFATPEEFNQKSLNDKARYISGALFNDACDATIERHESFKKNQFRLELVYSRKEEGKEVEDHIRLGTATNAKSKKEKFQSDLLNELYLNLYSGAVKSLEFESNFVTRDGFGKMSKIRQLNATIEKAATQESKPVKEAKDATKVNDYIDGIISDTKTEKAPEDKKGKTEKKPAKKAAPKAGKAAPKKSKAAPKAKAESKPKAKETPKPSKVSPENESPEQNICEILVDRTLKQSQKMKLIRQQLLEGVSDFRDSEQFKKFLRFSAKFHNYSPNNRFLLFSQAEMREMELSYVASAKVWNTLGYSIQKGQKALYVWAPRISKNKEEEPMENESDQEEKETKVYYVFYPVFDLSQTTATPEDIPQICKELDGEMENFSNIQAALIKYAESNGIAVAFGDTGSAAKGYFSPANNLIFVQSGMPEEQTIKTLVHELTHSIHDRDHKDGKTTNEREVIAEGTAYFLMSLLGVDPSQYSLGYISSWSTGKDNKELKEHIETIEKTAAKIYDFIQKESGADKKKAKAKETLNAKRETQQKAQKQAQQEKKAALMEELKEYETWPFDGGKVIINTGADRVQIYFDEKPSEAIRTSLKKHAWRYSPKNAGAWQRKITDNAKACCKEILGLA